jgi:hypothetical protein
VDVVSPLESGLRVAPGCPSYQLFRYAAVPILVLVWCSVFSCVALVFGWVVCSTLVRVAFVLRWGGVRVFPSVIPMPTLGRVVGDTRFPLVAGLVSSLIV